MSLLKYLKTLIYVVVPILILNIIISLLYYFNIIGNSINDYMKLFMIALSMFIGGIYIGNKTNKRGWLEGLKIGIEVIIILFITSYLAYDKGIDIKNLIYYFIIITASMLGSMVGINKRKRNM